MPWVPVAKAGAKTGEAKKEGGEEKDNAKEAQSRVGKTTKDTGKDKRVFADDWGRGSGAPGTMGRKGERTRTRAPEWPISDWSAVEWEMTEWDIIDWNVGNWDAVDWGTPEWAASEWASADWAMADWAAAEWGAPEWSVEDEYWTGDADWSASRGSAAGYVSGGKGGKKGLSRERVQQLPLGKGVGKGDDKGKGKDKGKSKDKGKGKPIKGVVDDMDWGRSQPPRPVRNEDARRQAKEEHGAHCTVKKHSSMGCAVVTINDPHVRQAILKESTELTIDEVKVKVKPHVDKETGKEFSHDLFVGWGHQAERLTPLTESDLVKFFDAKHEELHNSWLSQQEQMAQILSVGKVQRQKAEQDEAKRAAARKTNELQGLWAQGALPAAALAQQQQQVAQQHYQRQQQAAAAAQYSPQYQQQLAAYYASQQYQQQVAVQQQQQIHQQQMAAYYAHLRATNPQQYQALQQQHQQQQAQQQQQVQPPQQLLLQ